MPKQIESLTENHRCEELFFEADLFFESLLNDIKQAQHEIIIETYIFRLDSIGKRFVQALNNALQKGVRVNILIDGLGSYTDTQTITEQLQHQNCALKIFHPLPWDFNAYRQAIAAGTHLSKFLHFLGNINRRNHRKLYLIDNKIAWIGSFNITADHCNPGYKPDKNHWHDTALRIQDKRVKKLRRNFEEVWSSTQQPRTERAKVFFSSHSLQARQEKNHQLLHAIEKARHRIWITNAYFNPSKKLLVSLGLAAKNGVDVCVIVPAISDVVFFPWLSRSYYADLLEKKIRIFELKSKVLHSKTILIDDLAIVGSTNLNYRSLFHDMELDAILENQENMHLLEKKFLFDLNECTEITLATWSRFPVTLKLLGTTSRFLRYWM